MVVYLAVGLLVASVFGHDTLPVASLNWRNFTAGQSVAPGWAEKFSTALILFPTVDILSAFPLVAYCLGENLSLMGPENGRQSQRFALMAMWSHDKRKDFGVLSHRMLGL